MVPEGQELGAGLAGHLWAVAHMVSLSSGGAWGADRGPILALGAEAMEGPVPEGPRPRGDTCTHSAQAASALSGRETGGSGMSGIYFQNS